MGNIIGNFTGFNGRLNRQGWWISAIIAVVAYIILSWIIGAMLGTGMLMNPAAVTDPAAMTSYVQKAGWLSVILAIVFAYPYLAIGIKRRHDRNNNGYDVVGFVILEILYGIVTALGMGMSTTDVGGVAIPTPGPIAMVLGFIILIYLVYLLVVLGFLKGTAGPNNYGPDPLQG